MKLTKFIGMVVVFLAITSSSAFAGWSTCIGCHNGTVAPDKNKLVQQYPSVDAFIKAAQATKNPLMDTIKKDEKNLREAAQEIGLK
ncbi:MAG: hypothetical protein N3B18_06705 [Desulfobacterota bacterium]|nr:hypothetical protein [Thermodesulfobacteriota bacterium]